MKQNALFDSETEEAISIDDVAISLNVSPASVRNWIKAGYLAPAARNAVTVDSYKSFKDEVLGTEKLNQRANKSLKDQHDHGTIKEVVLNRLRSNQVDPEGLSSFYEESLSESYKNKEGVFYTPKEIVRELFDHLPDNVSDLTFCDPCCGTGNFLVEAVKRGFKPSNVYGFDTDDVALAISRRRLHDLTGGATLNIENRDFLSDLIKPGQEYDIIFTNPPWGKKLPKKQKDLLAGHLKAGSSKDTSAIFFIGCLNSVKQAGYLGFLLQDAFFNVGAYEDARKVALSNQIISLIDFGKPFNGLLTKAKGVVIKKKAPKAQHRVLCSSMTAKGEIAQKVYETNPKSIFNFTWPESDLRVIVHLLSIPHHTLRGNARWGLGIVTGNNKKFCSSKPRHGFVPVFKGAEITRSGLEGPSTFIPDDLSKYQQVAPIDLYSAHEKLIYKFISTELVFFHDTEQRLCLNSANLLVLNGDFPITHRQLCAMLNSRLMSWLFQRIFGTHKVLRSDLETLPIFTDYFSEYEEFSEEAFLDYLSLEEVSDGAYRIKN